MVGIDYAMCERSADCWCSAHQSCTPIRAGLRARPMPAQVPTSQPQPLNANAAISISKTARAQGIFKPSEPLPPARRRGPHPRNQALLAEMRAPRLKPGMEWRARRSGFLISPPRRIRTDELLSSRWGPPHYLEFTCRRPIVNPLIRSEYFCWSGPQVEPSWNFT